MADETPLRSFGLPDLTVQIVQQLTHGRHGVFNHQSTRNQVLKAKSDSYVRNEGNPLRALLLKIHNALSNKERKDGSAALSSVESEMLHVLNQAREQVFSNKSVKIDDVSEYILLLIKVCHGNDECLVVLAHFFLEAVFTVDREAQGTRTVVSRSRIHSVARRIAMSIRDAEQDDTENQRNEQERAAAFIQEAFIQEVETDDRTKLSITFLLGVLLGVPDERVTAWLHCFYNHYPRGQETKFPQTSRFQSFRYPVTERWRLELPITPTSSLDQQSLFWLPRDSTQAFGTPTNASDTLQLSGTGVEGDVEFLLRHIHTLLEQGANLSAILRFTKELDGRFPGRDFESTFRSGKLVEAVYSFVGNDLFLQDPSLHSITPTTINGQVSDQTAEWPLFTFKGFANNREIRELLRESHELSNHDELQIALKGPLQKPETDNEKALAGTLWKLQDFCFSEVLGDGHNTVVLGGSVQGNKAACRLENVRKDRFVHDFLVPIKFWRELQAECENVVKLFGFFVHETAVTLEEGEFVSVGTIMELCGKDLADLFQEKRDQLKKQSLYLDEYNEWVWTITKQLISFLVECSSKKFAHRDIKMENMFWSEDDQLLKVADFGLAKHVGSVSMTVGAGTEQYMAPEVRGSQNYTVACDMWSAGVLLYKMIKGEFPNTDYESLLERDLESLPEGDALADLCKKMLKWDASKRIEAKIAQNYVGEIAV